MRKRWWKLAVCLVIALVGVLVAPSPDAPLVTKLSALTSLPPHKQIEYFRDHPTALIAAMNASPSFVADWWKEFPKADRRYVATLMPEIFGNLDGIDYRSRDAANRVQLASRLKKAEKEVKEPPSTRTRLNLQALTAIAHTVEGHHTPARHLIALSLDSPPLAAVALGDLDHASQITYAIPGMGTYTTDMQLWTQSAQNIWDTQGKLGAPESRAVIAWIGYVAPPPGPAAALGDYAAQGAPLLVSDIEGIFAARHDHPTVSIVAHSYGTTMAADALASKDLGVWSFVMLGSAGVEERIGRASALHVKHVYAGEAAKDPEARWGRVTRIDPRAPSFGATVISVDGDPRQGLLGVTGHDPILHSAWNDNPLSAAWSGLDSAKSITAFVAHFQAYGYLDAGTESLVNAAIATTPHATVSLVGSHG